MSFLGTTWADLFTVAGVVISVWTLKVATKAKEAAEAAKAAARRQNLTEDLQDAQSKVEHLGNHLARQNWEVVLLLAQQATTACSQVLRRWGTDTLSRQSRDNILKSQAHVVAISNVAVRAPAVAPTAQDLRRLANTQQRAFQILSGELAESQRKLEGSP